MAALSEQPAPIPASPPLPLAPACPSRRTLVLAAVATPLTGFAPAQAQTPEEIPILVYHRFDPTAAGPTTVSVRTFESQLAWLAQNRYRIAPLREERHSDDRGNQPSRPRAAGRRHQGEGRGRRGPGVKQVMLPARNRRDFEDIPVEAREQLTFVWLDRVEDAVAAALEPATARVREIHAA